ncbi:hypothetical protein PIROE2DRAFT_58037 [Piromyces sp. E2]|nr:hypothetical protein PIROE2DRAFT_58037 [Piromyces sp. E2]|eukprot:OUM68487.1 hypothetical protein PIROE2DRAFT_58037 [Piromyces sp. E2]
MYAAGGLHPMKFSQYFVLKDTVSYLQNVYIPGLYHIHSIKPSEINTIHPIGGAIFDEVKTTNYFKTMMKVERKASTIIEGYILQTYRGYYISSINHLCKETIIKDKYYFAEGEETRILNDYFDKLQELENDLKSGKYGGKHSSDYSIFDKLNNKPGCVRVLEDYMNGIPVESYDLTNQTSIMELDFDIINNQFFNLFNNLKGDISGHISVMNELGAAYLLDETEKYMRITLAGHAVCSTIIFIIFYFFVSKPIKQQLRIIDSLTNITFSIPPSIYNSSPKIKNFIENGKLEE